ncbi:STE3-like pheromone receptor [Phlegmacium glaucopus]|nr:STE3-like pheromone receptor [Phlegmacium glaucopus]
MAVGPAAFLSFVNVTFLAVFIPVQRIRTNVPRLAIILWLLGFNLVHGINALVWSGNVDIHVPVWCDIVTKLMLGANLALPAAFFCVSLQLELLSSMRTISSHPTVVRNRLMSEIFMCYLLPILYMLLRAFYVSLPLCIFFF